MLNHLSNTDPEIAAIIAKENRKAGKRSRTHCV